MIEVKKPSLLNFLSGEKTKKLGDAGRYKEIMRRFVGADNFENMDLERAVFQLASKKYLKYFKYNIVTTRDMSIIRYGSGGSDPNVDDKKISKIWGKKSLSVGFVVVQLYYDSKRDYGQLERLRAKKVGSGEFLIRQNLEQIMANSLTAGVEGGDVVVEMFGKKQDFDLEQKENCCSISCFISRVECDEVVLGEADYLF